MCAAVPVNQAKTQNKYTARLLGYSTEVQCSHAEYAHEVKLMHNQKTLCTLPAQHSQVKRQSVAYLHQPGFDAGDQNWHQRLQRQTGSDSGWVSIKPREKEQHVQMQHLGLRLSITCNMILHLMISLPCEADKKSDADQLCTSSVAEMYSGP